MDPVMEAHKIKDEKETDCQKGILSAFTIKATENKY